MKFKSVFLATALSAICFIANANNTEPEACKDPRKSDVNGGVTHAETKKPLGNVVVTAYTNSKKEKSVATDINGNYNFLDLKPGTYKLVFEKSGYKKVTKEKVLIRSDDGCQLNIEMDEEDFDILPSSIFGFE